MTKMMKRQIVLLAAVVAAGLLFLALLQAPVVSAQEDGPAVPLVDAIDAAVAWLVETHQNADGGFSSFSVGADQAPSDLGGTLDALWGMSISGADTGPVTAYLEANRDQFTVYVTQDGSTASKALLALANKEDVSNFSGLDLVANLTTQLSPTGQYGVDTAFNQSLAMLGLTFSDHPTPGEAVTWLAEKQESEGELAGSWDDGFGTAGNADSTALAIAALLASGKPADDPTIVAGREFLARTQLDSGGWEYGSGFGENANSTALVLLALAMLGEDVAAEDGSWAKDGQSPLAALLNWQGESGAFQADFGDGRFDDFFSTAQTLPVLAYARALLGRSLLEAPVVENAAEALPQEMTPTAPPADTAAPDATAEPTEAPATATPVVVAETTVEESEASSGAAAAESETEPTTKDDGGISIWAWIIGAGVVVAVAALIWWLINKRKET